MARLHKAMRAYQAAHAAPSEPLANPTPGRRVQTPREGTFAESLGWTAGGTIVPGLGLLRTAWRPLGVVMLALTILLTLIGLTLGVLAPTMLLSLAVQPSLLTVAWIAVAVFGVVWVSSIAATQIMLRPHPTSLSQRLIGGVIVAVLALIVATPSFVAARSIRDTSLLIDGVFGQDTSSTSDFGTVTDPWANKPRLNVLILGGDAGADRTGTRTDTVILASIDTSTGASILFSLPRQTARMPFPEGTALHDRFPRGFTNGDPLDQNYALNAIYGVVPTLVDDPLIVDAEDPGAEALKLSVGEALGLEVDYYAMVNMDGFVELVNALGGITVNINVPVPVGGKNPTNVGGSDGFPPDRWLVPGADQHLNGEDALWFARGRYKTDDYARMSRQRCVIRAVTQQANPTTILANYEAITKAGRNIVQTDMPNRQAPAMLTLALKVKDASMTSVSFENGKDGFSTTNPDWDDVRERVAEAIAASNASPTEEPTSAPAAEPTVTGPASTEPTATATATATPSATATADTGQPASVTDECAYDPQPWPAKS